MDMNLSHNALFSLVLVLARRLFSQTRKAHYDGIHTATGLELLYMLYIPELADVKAYLINRERLYQCTNDSYACHDSTSPQEGLYRHLSRWVEEALNAFQGKGGGKGGLAQGQVGVKKILPWTSIMVSFHQCHKLHIIAKLGNSKMAVYETKKSDSFCLK
ncbi:hypothetical protein Tco_1131131, partial [Tanacetum coccineum]